jgi:ABC-type transport system involved in multi-copper enzyme maturation permease subunit
VTALVRADLRSRWRSIAALSFGAFVVLIVLSGTYSAYGGASGFAKAFGSGTSPKLFAAFAGTTSVNIFAPQNFLAFGFAHPLLLVLVLSVAVTTGVAAVATDVETGRAEILFTAPVSRATLLNARIIEWAVAQGAVIAAATVGALIGTRLSNDLSHVSPLVPFRVAVQLGSLSFFVAAAAFAASARAHSRGQAFGMAVGIAAGSYVANLVALLWEPLAWVRRVNVFGYYSATGAANHIEWGDVAVLVGAGLVLFAIAHLLLAKRDVA